MEKTLRSPVGHQKYLGESVKQDETCQKNHQVKLCHFFLGLDQSSGVDMSLHVSHIASM